MQILPINQKNDLDKLSNYIDEAFSPDDLVERLKSVVSPTLKCILIEEYFIDKDYASVFNHFYSKKYFRHDSHCTRLHFFSNVFQLIDGCLDPDPQDGKESYLGFIILRPTAEPLGRTITSPKLIEGFNGFLMTTEHIVNVNGHKLFVKGFPFKSQYGDVAVCAHIVCWAILRYYSQKFFTYPEKLTFDITQMASPAPQGGLMPSTGLRIDNAERIFSLAGCYPHVYDISEYKDNTHLFYRILYSHIESGFPLFGAMHKKRHAVALIGHGPYKSPNKTQYDREKGKNKFAFTWDFINSLVINDDNNMPYQVLLKDSFSSDGYSIEDIEAFVIPLPENIYYPAESLFCHLESFWTKDSALDFSHIDMPIIRCFIARSTNYKRFLRENKNDIPQQIFKCSLEISMPRYIWIAEISTPKLLEDKKVAIRLVFDATATPREKQPYLIIHDSKKVLVYDRGVTKKTFKFELESEAGNLKAFDRNLEHFEN